MTVEEYSKGLKRYFETKSAHRADYYGIDNCHNYNITCSGCIFNNCRRKTIVEKAEILEKWLKEHPVVTNGQHFIDEFGFDGYTCTLCTDCAYADCEQCQYSKHAEYKKPEVEK